MSNLSQIRKHPRYTHWVWSHPIATVASLLQSVESFEERSRSRCLETYDAIWDTSELGIIYDGFLKTMLDSSWRGVRINEDWLHPAGPLLYIHTRTAPEQHRRLFKGEGTIITGPDRLARRAKRLFKCHTHRLQTCSDPTGSEMQPCSFGWSLRFLGSNDNVTLAWSFNVFIAIAMRNLYILFVWYIWYFSFRKCYVICRSTMKARFFILWYTNIFVYLLLLIYIIIFNYINIIIIYLHNILYNIL